VQDGLGFELADSQGRFIAAEFDLGLDQSAISAHSIYHQVLLVMKHKHVKMCF
jgi:hypothetical protein